jgi:hypothetical protein
VNGQRAVLLLQLAGSRLESVDPIYQGHALNAEANINAAMFGLNHGL